MSRSLLRAPDWRRSYLLDVADRALDLVVHSLRADPADQAVAQAFARRALDLRKQLRPFLLQEPGASTPANEAGVRAALLEVRGLLQALLIDAQPASELRTNGEQVGPPAAVVVGVFGQPVWVRGKEKPRLTFAQYHVVSALVAAGDVGLTKDELEGVISDARGVLRRLRDSDADWKAVIHFAGKCGRRYRIG